MPKLDITSCKHPNSRKTKALTKHTKKLEIRKKKKLTQNIKQNLVGEKLAWFKQNLSESGSACTPLEMEQLIYRYICRFDDELTQIKLKHSVGNRKSRQHANREDIINMTIKREKEEFNTCGLEVPDLLNLTQLQLLRTWNGELRYLPNFILRRISKKYLDSEKSKIENQ